jgi:DHA2 family multidrug resistance protein
MAIFSMATVLSPMIGPVLGAWLTDSLSWRWCFYVNIPVGIVSVLLLWFAMPREAPKPRRFDFLGFTALAIGVASLQFMLDRGPSKDWFSSPEICAEAVLAAIGFWVYLAHSLSARHPLFDTGLARDRNFVVSCLIFCVFTSVMFTSLTLLPLMTQVVMAYPVMLAGMVAVPRGIMVMLLLQIAGWLDSRIDRRLLLGVAFAIMGYSFWRMSHFDLSMSPRSIATATAIQGFAQGIATVPLTTLAFTTLPAELRADASTFVGLLRNICGSVGISAIEAMNVANDARMHEALAAHVALDNPVVRAGLPAGLSPATSRPPRWKARSG